MVCTTQAKTGFKSALVFPRSPPCLDFSAEFLLVICLPSLTCKNATFSFASRRYIVGLYLCWWVFDIMKVYLSGSVSSAIACPTDVMKIRMQARLTKPCISFSNRNDLIWSTIEFCIFQDNRWQSERPASWVGHLPKGGRTGSLERGGTKQFRNINFYSAKRELYNTIFWHYH